jgi:thermitase
MNQVYKIIQKQPPSYQSRLFILDTGVDSEHPDLKDVFQKTNEINDRDKQGHGTHCAGIAGAMTGNSIGISSYNANGLYLVSSIKVLRDFGGGTQQSIIKGMIEAIDLGADVISLSLGGLSNDRRQKAYNEVVNYANISNTIIIVAAGNSNRNAKDYSPANSDGVITVAALDKEMKKAEFSNTLEDIKMGVSAPGVDILSTLPGDRYEPFSGTSMATPYVAGLIALMKCYDPAMNTEKAYKLLRDTGIKSQSSQVKVILNPALCLENLLKE